MGQLDALLVGKHPAALGQVYQLRPALTHPGGAAAPVIGAFGVGADAAAVAAAHPQQALDLSGHPGQAVADALHNGLDLGPHAGDHAGDAIKDRLHHVEKQFKDADGQVHNGGNDAPGRDQDVRYHGGHRADDVLNPTHLTAHELQHGTDLLADAVKDDLKDRGQRRYHRADPLDQPGDNRGRRRDHVTDGGDHRFQHGENRGNHRLNRGGDAGDGGHGRCGHLLHRPHHRGPKLGQLREQRGKALYNPVQNRLHRLRPLGQSTKDV